MPTSEPSYPPRATNMKTSSNDVKRQPTETTGFPPCGVQLSPFLSAATYSTHVSSQSSFTATRHGACLARASQSSRPACTTYAAKQRKFRRFSTKRLKNMSRAPLQKPCVASNAHHRNRSSRKVVCGSSGHLCATNPTSQEST